MSKRMKKPRRAGEHPKANKPTQRQITAAYYNRRSLEILPPVPDDAPVVEEPREGPPTPEPAPTYQPAATRDLGEEGAILPQRPVLAFFYPWYAETQWTQ